MIDDHGRNSNLAILLSVLWSPTTFCVAALHAIYVVLSYYDGMLASVFFLVQHGRRRHLHCCRLFGTESGCVLSACLS